MFLHSASYQEVVKSLYHIKDTKPSLSREISLSRRIKADEGLHQLLTSYDGGPLDPLTADPHMETYNYSPSHGAYVEPRRSIPPYPV